MNPMPNPSEIAATEEEFGGWWDDVQTAREWLPILAMLKAIKDEADLVAKLERIRDAAAFAVKTTTGADPYKRRGFLIFAKAVDTIKHDPAWRSIVLEMLQ